jgi:pyruvate dehydrogenase E1 component alpha subunit
MSTSALQNSPVTDPTEFAHYPINQKLTAAEKIRLLTEMLRIRRFEECAGKHYADSKMAGFLHRYDGQESIAVGHASLMGENDHMITAYRCHAHALACGMDMNECMAELFGRATGCSKGKGGSMHFFDPSKRYWGGHGIVGGQTPLGLGLAYYQKYWNLTGACFCYMGDGAVNQGAFHESLNLASLMDIPVIYVIENNGYSMGTSQCRSSAYKNCLAYRADGYNIVWDLINGWDLYEVRAKSQIALERAHLEKRPTVIEIMTYRHYGHSVADAKHKVYRSEAEIERYKQQDPIQLWKNTLLAEGVLTEETYKEIDKAAKAEANAAADFAENSPYPEFEDITKDVYWEVDNNTERGRTGRHFFNE